MSYSVKAEQISGVQGNDRDASGFTPLSIETLTSVRHHKTLVRSTKTIKSCADGECIDRASTLQVALLVLDNGPSTDVSSPAVLYLTMYNSVEETGVGKSMHLIDDIVEFYSSKRISAGIYEVEYKAFRLDGECQLPKVSATIDARTLSAKVRAAKEVRMLENHVFMDPIYVEKKVLSCESR